MKMKSPPIGPNETQGRFGELLIQSLRQASAHARGEPDAPARLVVRKWRDYQIGPPPTYTAQQIIDIRRAMGLPQKLFAKALNVSLATVRAWEQGERLPSGPSLRLLEFAATTPMRFECCGELESADEVATTPSDGINGVTPAAATTPEPIRATAD